MGTGLGGFQEAHQLPMFQEFVKYQGHVNNPKRMAEITARCFDRAMRDIGPTQLNIPRDYFYGEIDVEKTTQAINDVIEGWVREHPEQWLWLHRKWRDE